MDTTKLESKFARIGARLKVATWPTGPRQSSGLVSLDVVTDRQGEFFEVVPPTHRAIAEILVLDVQPDDRHLLLLVREGSQKFKYLCGHDERHWFIAAVPDGAPVGTVRQAKEALKPREVRLAQAHERVPSSDRNRRKNGAFTRQGEWFFLPMPGFVVDDSLVLKDEPLQRGRGNPHRAEFCYRAGGELVYVCPRHPNGVTPKQYEGILTGNPGAQAWPWRQMRRNPGVYVRGRVRHADHKTILLRGWHRVLMNTENESRAMRNMAFLD